MNFPDLARDKNEFQRVVSGGYRTIGRRSKKQGAVCLWQTAAQWIKILYFDGTGVCVLAKRLEEGTFHWPQSAAEPNAKLRLSSSALQLLLDGVELKAAGRRAWYEAL